MYPEKLESQQGKQNWSTADCFSATDLDYVLPGLHSNYAIGMHSHDFYEINLITRGTGRHYIESNSCDVVKGSVFVIPPHIRHGYYPYDQLDVYHILIRCEFFSRYASELHACPGYNALFEIEPFLRGRFEKTLFLTLDSNSLEQYFLELRELERLRSMQYEGKYGLLNARTLCLIGGLCQMMSQTEAASSDQNAPDCRLILQCMENIRRNAEEKWTISKLAKQAGMSRSTFLRHFGAVCRCTPLEYLTQVRVEKAKSLLLTTSLSVTEIAQECGFYDCSHLIKHFVQEFGISPASYRKKVKTNR